MSDDEFVELLWENGQIVLHGQSSSRPKKHPFPAPFMPFDSRRSNEKAGGGCGGGGGGGGDAVLPKMGQFSSTGPPLHDFSATEEAAALSTHDDGSVPWVHYPIIDDPLQAEYCSGLLSELPQGPAALASLPSNNVAIHSNNKTDASVRAAAANSNSMEHWNASRVAHSGGGLLDTRCRSRSSHLSEPSRHCQSSTPRARPGPPDFSSLGTARDPAVISKPVQPSSSSQSVMNFSLFTRPVALAKANLESTERPRSNNDRKASAASISNPVESTIVQTASGLKSFSMVPERAVSLPPKELGLSTSAPQQTLSPKQTPAVVPEKDVIRSKIGANLAGGSSSSIMPRSSQFAASASVERDEAGKAPEAVVATSSVCSGNGAGHASNSNDPQHKLKRKYQAEGSASQEEDLEDESGVLRRSPPRSTKRSRTAQVHNLSERRRRDRINEKMRALQELIPNCNKVDKASMLDEAIEYLKTLQLQVQMMSMGSGLCIPPVLLPPTMQHLQIPPMHFPQMGMGLGYGLGMLDVNSSTGCPMIPLPHMNGAQFPCPIIPGAQSMTLPGSNAMPMFGLPGQGIPSQAPRMPPFASLAGFPTRANLVPQISGSKSNLVQEQLPSLENQQQRSVNLEATREVNAGDSQTQTISQGGKQFFKLPSLAQTTSPLLRTSVNGAANSTCQNEAEPSKTTSTG